MSTPRRSSVKLLALLLLFFCWMEGSDRAIAESTIGDGNQGLKRALLIGINKYKAIPRLQGSLNDIETMRQILLTRWGFSEKNITVVTDEGATRAGMLAALEQLVKDSGPNDTVYFHYSGHGSQVEDLNGDEKDDGLDETLVPQDGRSGNVRDITDDELDAVFARLRTKQAFIVLDSCHSGTATRSLDIRTRSIPRETRVDLYREAENTQTKTRGVVPVVASRYVVMTGAAPHQEALDGPVDGRYHGFFTYALSRSLSSASPQASARDVFTGVERELKRIQTNFGRSSMPEPQLEAPPGLIERTLLGEISGGGTPTGSKQEPRLPWLDVIPTDSGQVLLQNGIILGASPGSTWAIYPPGEQRFTPGQALAIGTVVGITGKDVTAKLQSPSAKIQPHSRAIALLPPSNNKTIPIRFLDIPPERRKQVEEVLRRTIPDIEIVADNKSARFLVDAQDNVLRLLAADGLQVVGTFGMNNDQWGKALALVISRSVNASELLTLDNPASQLKVSARVINAAAPRPAVSTRSIAVVAGDTKPTQYRIRRQGEPRQQHNSLQLELQVSADSYITIVDVDSEGAMNLLFPNNVQQASFLKDGLVKANEPLLIPDSLEPGNRAGFYWDYTPPAGTDTVRVFASTDLETAQAIRQRIQGLQTAITQTRGGAVTRPVSAAIKTLREVLSSRGLITVYDPTSHVPTRTETGNSIESVSSPLTDSTVAPSSSPIPSTGVAPDWSAISVMIEIEN